LKKVLVIDSDTYTCDLLVNHLNKNGYDAKATYTAKNGINLIETKRFDFVLCGYQLPDSDGYKVLQEIKSKKPLIPVVIMTVYKEIRLAVKMIKSGAFDYITKPVHPEEIINIINKALETQKGKETKSSFRTRFITGDSESMQDIMKQVKVVAPTDVTVLIEGETGSGKEYIAKAIHFASARSNKPFVAVDCGAIPKDLANSELFGHIKGAFTGAVNNKTGYFEQARGGTLFLDEVGNLPYENQVKLLRAIQERYISKVGDDKLIKVDVRIITASNEDLQLLAERNEFREDLYHRLNGFKINLPPLRERGNDILKFTNFFIKKANAAFNKNIKGVDEEARNLLFNYSWHGNIRELQNIINRSVLLSQSEILTIDTFPEEIVSESNEGAAIPGYSNNSDVVELKEATNIAEKNVITKALIETNYNKSEAAKRLNIDRKTLYNKIKQFNIDIKK